MALPAPSKMKSAKSLLAPNPYIPYIPYPPYTPYINKKNP